MYPKCYYLTRRSTSLTIPCHINRSLILHRVLVFPMCPAVGSTWQEWRILLRFSLLSINRKSLSKITVKTPIIRLISFAMRIYIAEFWEVKLVFHTWKIIFYRNKRGQYGIQNCGDCKTSITRLETRHWIHLVSYLYVVQTYLHM